MLDTSSSAVFECSLVCLAGWSSVGTPTNLYTISQSAFTAFAIALELPRSWKLISWHQPFEPPVLRSFKARLIQDARMNALSSLFSPALVLGQQHRQQRVRRDCSERARRSTTLLALKPQWAA